MALSLTRRNREYVRTANYGIGRWYWAWEREATGPVFTTKAWLRGLAYPYREGHNAWRLRAGHRAVQVGRCVLHPEYDDVFQQIGGGELGEWRPPRRSVAAQDEDQA